MPAQRTAAGSGARNSAFPGVAGVAPWAAVLIAVGGTLLGIAIEAGSGHRELGPAFAACFALGCITAALLVRQSGVFTAVVQPPLLLFVAVPLAYFLFHGEELNGLKGFLITCCYPLIERFPLMLLTTAAVFIIGLARWYLPVPGHGRGAAHEETAVAATGFGSMFGGLGSRLFARSGAADDERPRHGMDRGSTTARGSRAPRTTRDTRDRTRVDRGERVPPSDPSRRQSARRPVRPAGEAPTERRRQRPVREAGREAPRRQQRERRDPREGREARSTREGYPSRHRRDPDYRPSAPRSNEPGYEAGYRSPDAGAARGYPPRRADGAQPYPPPPRRRTEPPPQRRPDSDHHPVSRVRYRGGSEPDQRDYPDYPPRRRP